MLERCAVVRCSAAGFAADRSNAAVFDPIFRCCAAGFTADRSNAVDRSTWVREHLSIAMMCAIIPSIPFLIVSCYTLYALSCLFHYTSLLICFWDTPATSMYYSYAFSYITHVCLHHVYHYQQQCITLDVSLRYAWSYQTSMFYSWFVSMIVTVNQFQYPSCTLAIYLEYAQAFTIYASHFKMATIVTQIKVLARLWRCGMTHSDVVSECIISDDIGDW